MPDKRTVLIVDDDVATSQMEKLILEGTGLYSVAICNRGSEAIKVIQEIRPALVLLDVMMPEVDGTEIARRIEQDPSLASMQIVFVTALASPEDVRGEGLIGGRPFIPKPIGGKAFIDRVNGFFPTN